jgi:hypothetical protein
MKYAQIRKGLKLHLVYDYGDLGLSKTLCGISPELYRLTINLPMGMSCKNCERVYNSRHK